VFSADQGWAPLCEFLRVPVPATPFPNVNDRVQVKKGIADMTKGAYAILGLIAALLSAAILGAIHLSRHS
jgi:hypothetical protein